MKEGWIISDWNPEHDSLTFGISLLANIVYFRKVIL